MRKLDNILDILQVLEYWSKDCYARTRDVSTETALNQKVTEETEID